VEAHTFVFLPWIRDEYERLISNDEGVSNVNSMVSMVNDTHKSRGRHQPIRDKLISEVRVKLELVNTGLENVDKTQKS